MLQVKDSRFNPTDASLRSKRRHQFMIGALHFVSFSRFLLRFDYWIRRFESEVRSRYEGSNSAKICNAALSRSLML